MHHANACSQSPSTLALLLVEPLPEQARSIRDFTRNTNNTSQKYTLAPLRAFVRLCSASADATILIIAPLILYTWTASYLEYLYLMRTPDGYFDLDSAQSMH